MKGYPIKSDFGIKKVDLMGVINAEEDAGDIGVKTILKDELPAVEDVRDNVKLMQNSIEANQNILKTKLHDKKSPNNIFEPTPSTIITEIEL